MTEPIITMRGARGGAAGVRWRLSWPESAP